jgi:hypothetical protein
LIPEKTGEDRIPLALRVFEHRVGCDLGSRRYIKRADTSKW